MENRTEGLINQLVEIVGSDWVKTDDMELQQYGKDWTKVFHPDPIAIVLPSSIEDVQTIVKVAMDNQVALVPSGGRTGLWWGSCGAA